MPPIPGGDTGGGDTTPVVAEDILSALPDEFLNEDGEFDSTEFTPTPHRANGGSASDDFSALRGSGQHEDDAFVESVLRGIDRILGPSEARGLADGTDAELFVARVLIDSNWSSVKSELDAIFGSAGQTLLSETAQRRSGATDVIASVSGLEDLREDLSDIGKFKDRFISQITGATGTTGDKIYEARKRVLALGACANAGFGVISTLAAGATAEPTAGGRRAIGATADRTATAFAFSPLEATDTIDLPNRGTARYSGRAWVTDSSQVLHSGLIELLASIAISKIGAKISNLRRSNSSVDWMHNGKDVREIMPPEIKRGEFARTNRSFGRLGLRPDLPASTCRAQLGPLLPRP